MSSTVLVPNNTDSITGNGSIITGGSNNWTNPTSAATSNNIGAFVGLSSNSTTVSRYLVFQNLGASIPSGSSIDGFILTIKRKKADSGGEIRDAEIKLCKGSSVFGNNKADTVNDWSASYATVTYGSSTDTWGTSFTVSDINALDFGFVIRPYNSGGTIGADADVDYATLEVFYSEPVSATPTPTLTSTPTPTPTNSATVTPSPTVTPTLSTTPTVTPSTTPSTVDPVDGFNLEIANGVKVIFLNPDSTLATGTIKMPSMPVDKQVIEVLTSKQISELTVLPNMSQSLTPNPPTLMLAGSGFSYRFNATLDKWFRRW
jgi:hypothetical protein